MMRKKRLLVAALALSALTTHAQRMIGGDLSMLPKYEAAHVTYKDAQNNAIGDLLDYVHTEAGYNIVRLRLFVNPTGETGVVQDLDYVKQLGKRVRQAGMSLMLDFHYSDTWADPSNQWTPEAWKQLTDEQLYQKIYDYTADCLQQLIDAGATPDYIQTGNEISYGMLWGPKGTSTGSQKRVNTGSNANWDRFRTLLARAGQACREKCPEAKIIIHTERTGAWSTCKGIYDRLASVDYDIIGLSYYPEWHNNLATLKNTVSNLKNYYPTKQVMIVETGYYNNWYPSNATYNFTSTWPASAAGQKKFLDDLVATAAELDNLTGLLYWFPEENPYNNRVYEPWYNHGLFDPNTGKVTDGLFAMKPLADETAVTNVFGTDTEPADQTTYTLDGRRLASRQLPPGIYVRNHRKVVVK